MLLASDVYLVDIKVLNILISLLSQDIGNTKFKCNAKKC